MPVKTFTFKNELFITGRTKCACCDHRFKYALPFQTLLLWENMCAVCAPGLIDLPAKGKIVYAELDLDEWA